MSEKSKKDVLVMALFVVTKDSVFSCADELGIPQDQITDDIIETVRLKVSDILGGWREVVKSMVKETIERGDIECPLGLACSSSCPWREADECMFLREVR